MAARKKAPTILVVDDDQGLARLIERLLRREKYHASAAFSGKEALAWLQQHEVDLMLLDLKLPDLSGMELIACMRSAGYDVPFIIMTGQGDERVAVQMMKSGALDYLIKDVQFLDFVPAVIQRALGMVEDKKRLAVAEQNRKRLEKEILEISEREQQRIGHDLHDDLGQQLAGIWCLNRVLEGSLAAQKSPEAASASKITALLKDAMALTRNLARGLHPVAVEAGGLAVALEELRQRTAEMFDVTCRCHCPTTLAIDNTVATHLYRIAQEAVTNAIKHGQAREIEIKISSNAHSTILSVKDQGIGIALLPSVQKGMGLRIMNYRAGMIGGVLTIEGNPDGGGTIVMCTVSTSKTSIES